MNILEKKNPDKLHVLFISEILELHTFFDALFPSGSPYIFFFRYVYTSLLLYPPPPANKVWGI